MQNAKLAIIVNDQIKLSFRPKGEILVSTIGEILKNLS